MPNVTVYIRNEDLEKWKALKNKAGAISMMLNGEEGTLDLPLPPETPDLKQIRNYLSEKKSVGATPTVRVVRNINADTGLPEHRTGAVIVGEIKSLEAEVAGADFTNQDPDYWEVINGKKTKIESLWKEWHEVTGR